MSEFTFDIPLVEGVPSISENHFQDLLERFKALPRTPFPRTPRNLVWGAKPTEDSPVTMTNDTHDEEDKRKAAAAVDGALECIKFCSPLFSMEIWSPWQCESILKGVLGLDTVFDLSIGWDAQIPSRLRLDVPEEQSGAALRTLIRLTSMRLRSIWIGRSIFITENRHGLVLRVERIRLVEQFQEVNAIFAIPSKIHGLHLPDGRFKDEMEKHLTALNDCTTLEEVTISAGVEFNFFPKSGLRRVRLLFLRQQNVPVFKVLRAALLAQSGLEELHVGLDVGVNLNEPDQLAHLTAFAGALQHHGLRMLRLFGLCGRNRSRNTNPPLSTNCLVGLFRAIGRSRVEELKFVGLPRHEPDVERGSDSMMLDINGFARGLGVLEQNASLKYLFVRTTKNVELEYFVKEAALSLAAALERNLSVVDMYGNSNRCFSFPRFVRVFRRNRLLAEAKTGMGVVREAAGYAVLPHFLSKLVSNDGEGTPLFALLRSNPGELIDATSR